MTTPEDLITPEYDFMMRNKRHGVLAPKVAEDRWQALQAVVSEIERLSELYYQRAEEAEDARLAAVAANARAADTGKAVPAGTAVKVMDAQLAVDGTLRAFRDNLPRLTAARRDYDALFSDRNFIAEYREAVAAEFVKRRAAVVKAFKELDAQIPALAELYDMIGKFTLDGLLGDTLASLEYDGEKLTHGGVFTGQGHGSWDDPKLSKAMSEVRRYVLNEDPIMGGTLLAEDLDTISAELPALLEKRYEEWQEKLAESRMEMRNANPW
jgi:molybdopterin converting factor small subunit